MKILIIKNDGFGDLIIIKDLLKKINKEKNEIDIVLSKHNEIFFNQLINIQNKYVFDLYGPNFNIKKNVPRKDKKLLKKLNNKSYDLCIVLRRYLNTEQVAILNHINTKKIFLCYQFYNSEIELKKKFFKINVPKHYINDYDYFFYFLKKIKLLKYNSKYLINKRHKKNNYLVLNLSGEKQFKEIDNLEILLKIILKNFNNKIYLIGKTFNKQMNVKINKKLTKIKNINLINLWSKTNFKYSMKIIKNSEYYVGFDTGLSHYASLENKKSLIILNSGGANKWFPHSKNFISNTTYWVYNTACAGCNFSGNYNKCHYNVRYCVDNIFLEKDKVNNNFIKFLKNKSVKFINYSNNNFISTDWNQKAKNIEFKIINKSGYLNDSKKFLNNLYFIFKNFFILIKNQNKIILTIKLLLKNLVSLFYQTIIR